MNKEIKEILFLLHNDRLTESGKRKLEDYITNLENTIKEQEDTIIDKNECIFGLESSLTNLQEQLHQASLDIQELTERDIWCSSNCDKLTKLQEELEEQKRIEKADFKLIQELEEEISHYQEVLDYQEDFNIHLNKSLKHLEKRIDKVIEYNYGLQERYCHSDLFDELIASKIYEITEKQLNILKGEE